MDADLRETTLSRTLSFDTYTQQCTPDEPEYYSEVLHLLHHEAGRNSLAVNAFDPDLDFRDAVEGLDPLFDSLALAALPAPGYRSSLTISINQGRQSCFSTTLYVTFDRPVPNPESVALRFHRIFALLRSKHLPRLEQEPAELAQYLATTFSDLLLEIYGHSWEVFSTIVLERAEAFRKLQQAAERRRSGNTRRDSELAGSEVLFADLNRIIRSVNGWKAGLAPARATVQLVGQVFNRWHRKGLLPRQLGDGATELLDRLDALSAGLSGAVSFSLRQWLFDIFSLHTGALTLLTVWLSDRHNDIYQGEFRVEVMSSPLPDRYTCHFIQPNLGRATSEAVEASQHLADCPTRPEQAQFARMLHRAALNGGKETLRHPTPVIHCEIALLVYLRAQSILTVGYTGNSTLACETCSVALAACSERVNETVARRGREKVYSSGWTFPTDTCAQVEREVLPLVLDSLQLELGRDCTRWLDWKFMEEKERKKGASRMRIAGFSRSG